VKARQERSQGMKCETGTSTEKGRAAVFRTFQKGKVRFLGRTRKLKRTASKNDAQVVGETLKKEKMGNKNSDVRTSD